jgi:transposase
MRDRELYATILGLKSPWSVARVELKEKEGEVLVFVALSEDRAVRCPTCGRAGPRYDVRERRWRHLDTCQYRTILVADVPRVRCAEHGVLQIAVPWAEAGSRFTALFEALAIDWMLETSLSAVARGMRLTWDQVAGIQERAVRRGLARRKPKEFTSIGVDETSARRGQRYLTIVSDPITSTAEYVADGRGRETLDTFYKGIGAEGCEALVSVAMDMWSPYIESTRDHVPHADDKIVFDKFHVAQHLGEAVDKVRRSENRALVEQGDDRLKGTKYLWLTNRENMTEERRLKFEPLRNSSLRTARAWAIRETAMSLWGYATRGWAERAWKQWVGWAIRSQLEPVKKVARMIVRHWTGVMNAVISGITNAGAEGLNGKVQRLKKEACGFRNTRRFINAIYFRLGGLDLYPEAVRSIHSNA